MEFEDLKLILFTLFILGIGILVFAFSVIDQKIANEHCEQMNYYESDPVLFGDTFRCRNISSNGEFIEESGEFSLKYVKEMMEGMG
jgi:hypothetical protein